MVVEVHLHTTLQRLELSRDRRRFLMELPPGSTLGDVVSQLEIKLEPEHLLLVVNGRSAEAEQSLSDGDIIHLIPAISGGS